MKTTPDGQVIWNGQDVREQAQPWDKTAGAEDKIQSAEIEAIKAFTAANGRKPTEAELDGIHKRFKEAGTVVRVSTGGAGGGGGGNPKTWDTTGADVLKMIPPQWRATVKKIGDYDEDPTKVLAARGGQRAMVMQWVNQYNPDYKQDEFAVRSPTRKAFTTGTQGQQINAMNTAIGHIDQLSTLVDRLGNGAFTPGNQVWNTVQTMFGTDKVTNFDTLKDFLSGEVASILSKNGATVSGIAEAKEKINSSNSPQQLAGYIKTVIPVMGSKLASLDYQYKQAMGDDKFSALSPESKRILEKYGFDPSHPTLDGGGGPKQQPIPGVPGGVAELRNGRWIRVK
jgi:ribosomal protein L24